MNPDPLTVWPEDDNLPDSTIHRPELVRALVIGILLAAPLYLALVWFLVTLMGER